MIAIGSKIVLATAALAGAAAFSGGQQPPQVAPSGAPAPIGNPALASTLATWRALQQTDSLPFDMYAGFLLAHPGWPGEAANRRAAERQAGTASPGSVVAFFRRYPPQSASAGVAHARALLATGLRAEAAEAARRAWRTGALSPTDEAVVQGSFPGALTADDQDQRMDALLWQGSTGAAARQLGLVSPARRGAFTARLAFRTEAANAAELSASTAALYGDDAGYIADRAVWLRNSGASGTARAWLARPRTLRYRPGNVEKWYEVLLTNARAAAEDEQWQTAYDIARQIDDAYPAGTVIATRPYGERDDYTSLAWLAGQTALKQINRPADAMTLFDRYGLGSRAPQTRSKGLYWAGRAAEAAGRTADATTFLTAAAAFRDQYYGQLAGERRGTTGAALPAYAPRSVDPATRNAFFARETVRAAQFLGNIGARKDQTAFLRQIAQDASSDSDHVLATELAQQLNRADLQVMIGRSAHQNGLADYAVAGFPTVSAANAYAEDWTVIHAIMRQESQFDREAVSSAGARGLMQLMPATAREQASKLGVTYEPNRLTADPGFNIMLGSTYFARMYRVYSSYPLAVAAYNAGGGNVNKWLRANGDPRTGAVDWVDWVEAIPYSETRNYVQRVLENAVVYDQIAPDRARSRGPARLSWYLGKSRPG